MKWAITDQFKEYLWYSPFVVRTDNNPLNYILTTPNLDACGHRWVASLANYILTIGYQKGKNNAAADTLSYMGESLNIKDVKAILSDSIVGCSQWAELPLEVHQVGK